MCQKKCQNVPNDPNKCENDLNPGHSRTFKDIPRQSLTFSYEPRTKFRMSKPSTLNLFDSPIHPAIENRKSKIRSTIDCPYGSLRLTYGSIENSASKKA